VARLRVRWLVALAAGTLVVGCGGAPNAPATGVVRGHVTRIYSDLPIGGASVSVADENAVTGPDGSFQIDHAPQGPAVLAVTAPEYRGLTVPLEIGAFQSLDLSLVPLDTLVDIAGRVSHRADGPLAVQLDVGGRSLTSDEDGRWELAQVPIGPLVVSFVRSPYNPYAEQFLVHSDGQVLEQVATRDTTVDWLVDDDAYVFTRDDSLNANRGHHPWLIVSTDFGRTAYFSLVPPAWERDWALIVAARLDLHGFIVPDDEHPADPQVLALRAGHLDAPFEEGAIDYYNRPATLSLRSVQVEMAGDPWDQPFTVDLVGPTTPVRPDALGGATIAAAAPQAMLMIASNDHAAPAVRPRARYTYRF